MKRRKRFRKRRQRDFSVCGKKRVGLQVLRCVVRMIGRREIVTHAPAVCSDGHRVLWRADGDWECEGVAVCEHTHGPYPEDRVA